MAGGLAALRGTVDDGGRICAGAAQYASIERTVSENTSRPDAGPASSARPLQLSGATPTATPPAPHGSAGDPAVQKRCRKRLQLIEAARQADVWRFVFISTCAVHEKILDDRPLDETHPTWATSHYGAHKAAIEQFVHSYGFGEGFPICALRPTGIYGLAHPVAQSRWYPLVQAVVRGESVECHGGGKEVHASDVAWAVEILLTAEGVAGEVYNCYDRYISQHEVASIAKRLSASHSEIRGAPSTAKHQIVTQKLQRLGMTFGGRALLEYTIQQMLDAL